MTELGLLAREVGVHERTLRRAIAEGSIRARRPSPRKLELPLSERQYVRRHWPLLSTLREVLRTQGQVRLALLFGSTARGTGTAGSDIDILVDLRDSQLDALLDLEEGLGRATGRRVQLVRLADAEDDPSFLAEVLSEGRVLVDRDDVWPVLRLRQPTIRRRAHRAEARRTAVALAGIDRLLAG
jgi:predicted nucleotidyltransferase